MTREEFGILVKAMKAIYTSERFIPDKDSFDVWYGILSDLDYKVASAALKKHMQSSNRVVTPADIRNGVASFSQRHEITDGEAWAMVSNAISRSGYYSELEFNKLPELIQKAVGNPRQLKQWSQTNVDEVETVIHSQFLRSYRAQVEKRKNTAGLSPDLLKMLEGGTDETKRITTRSVDQIGV